MRRPIPILWSCVALALLGSAQVGHAHGDAEHSYRVRVLEITPAGVPVDVSMDGDQIRFENAGDRELVLCGYEIEGCERWVRLGPDGVFEDRNARSWHANTETDTPGPIPDDAGTAPDWVRVRRAPAFYAYHDHRVHWMGGDRLPPGVDDGDSSPQRVYDGRIAFRYGATDGFVRTRLEYIGGRSWLDRNGEYAATAGIALAMIGAYLIDARRRRHRRHAAIGRSQDDVAG